MRLSVPRLLSPLLLVALLAGCGDSEGDAGTSSASGTNGTGTAAADLDPKCREVPSGAVAVVDCEPIQKTEFDHLLAVGVAQLKQQGQPVPKAGSAEHERLRERVLKYLVQRVEISKEAEKAGVKVDAKKVDEGLTAYKKDCCGGKEAEYQKQLKASGLTEEDIRKNLELNQLGEGLYKKVTDDASFTFPQSRRVAHILLDVKPVGKVTDADRKAAEKVLAQLKAGGNFAALAKKHSTDPGSKDNGGEYLEKKGEFDPAFEKAAFALETGQLTEQPVKTAYGYHIIKALGDLQPEAKKAVADAKSPEEQQLADQARSEAGSKWFTDIEKYYAARTFFAEGYRIEPAPETPATTGAETPTTGTETSGTETTGTTGATTGG
jgi:peptidyl-prolyl cis-trans isomerase C